MEARVTVEEYVGLRIRERREELGMGAVEFGSQLGEFLGKPWPRQAVSAAELGKRSLGVTEIVAIAHVLHTSPAHLFIPPAETSEIGMPGGVTFPRDMLFAELIARPREDWNYPAVVETLRLLLERAERSQDDAAGIRKLVQDLDMLITQRVAGGGVVSMPPAQGMIAAAIITSDLGVLVGKRNDRTPPWTFIAGEQEPGEPPADTITREVKEETGLEIEAGKVIGMRVHPDTGRTMIYVTGRPVRGTDVFVGDEAELAEVKWASLAEAVELLPGMFGPAREHLERELGEAAR